MFAAPMIAENYNIPFIPAVLQPASLYSAYDPPRIPEFRIMHGAPVGALGLGWNRLLYALIRRSLRRRYAPVIDALRVAHGLAPANQAILLDPGRTPAFNLGCYSALFAPLPPDAPPGTLLAGFPLFDSFSGQSEVLEPALDLFLAAGPPPIVFTLGSVMVRAAGAFYAQAAEVAARLGRRAVLLTGQEATAIPPRDDLFVTQYAPHSALFPRAAIIVHHGGVGTTGQALRAGKPQLVVPHMLDQFDHGLRIAGLGVGASLTAKKFGVAAAQAQLAHLLQNPNTRQEAARLGALLQAENGAQVAAAAIEAVI
jgi:UDP:flavonoid glycosyltransferase YjiC (YdhE family)